MAYFYPYDVSKGWWFYFAMVIAANKDEPEIVEEYLAELRFLIKRENVNNNGQNDTQQKRISVRKVRSKEY